MSLPAYNPELMHALAKVFAEAALDQLIRDMDSQAQPGELVDEQQQADAKHTT